MTRLPSARSLLRIVWLLPLIWLSACDCGDDDPAQSGASSGRPQPDDDDDSPAGDDDNAAADDDNDDASPPADDDESPDDDDDDESPDDDDDDDDDNDDDDNDDDDNDDDDNDDDDTQQPSEGFVITDGDLRLELIDGGSLGATGVDAAVGSGGELYVISTRSRVLTLYTLVDGNVTRLGLGALATDPRLAVDAAGALHIVYRDLVAQRLWRHTNESGSWLRESVAHEAGIQPPGLGLGEDGRLHVCFASEAGLRYAVRDGGAWALETASTTEAGDCDVAATAAGEVRLLYVEDSALGQQLALRSRSAKDWAHEILVSDDFFAGWWHGFRRPRFAFDHAGGLGGVAAVWIETPFVETYGVAYVREAQDAWPFDVFGIDGDAANVWLGFDAADQAHVLCSEGNWMVHTFGQPGAWAAETIVESGDPEYAAGAFDAAGALRAFWGASATLSLRSAEKSTEAKGWAVTLLDQSGAMGERHAMTIDPTDKAHVLYGDRQGDRFLWVDEAVGGWERNELAPCQSGGWLDSYARLDLAQDGDGKLHAAWIHCAPDQYSVAYAKQTEDGWAIEEASPHFANYGVSLAIDDEGFAHIAFEDNTDYGITYLTNRSGAWAGAAAGPQMDSGQPTIAVDADHAAHIAYIALNAQSYEDLRYATNASGAWSNQLVAPGLLTYYRSPAIALDAGGEPVLAATENFHGAIFRTDVFRRNRAGWQKEVVAEYQPDGNFYFDSCSLALDETGAAHLSFCWGCYWYNPPSLIYATDAGGAWTLATVDDFAPDDSITDRLALDHAGNVQVSYFMAQGLWRAVFPRGWTGN